MTGKWISHLALSNPTASFHPLDVRRSISSQFQTLAAFCHLATQSVADALRSLNTSKLIIPQMLSYPSFKAQVETLISNYRTNLINEQKRTNVLVKSMNQLNQLPTALSTNYLYRINTSGRNFLNFVR